MGGRGKLIAAMAVLAMVGAGCGSTHNDDRLVLQFIRFDGSNIEQEDAVSENHAEVDIFQDICSGGAEGELTVEPFTQTSVNAVFRNHQKSDIHLEGYAVNVPRSGLGNITGTIGRNVAGGRCTNVDRACAVDGDCTLAGSAGGTCFHQDTIISGILLFDIHDKLAANPGTYNMTVTFYASDPNRSFQVSAGYVVTFANFDNCPSTGGTQ